MGTIDVIHCAGRFLFEDALQRITDGQHFLRLRLRVRVRAKRTEITLSLYCKKNFFDRLTVRKISLRHLDQFIATRQTFQSFLAWFNKSLRVKVRFHIILVHFQKIDKTDSNSDVDFLILDFSLSRTVLPANRFVNKGSDILAGREILVLNPSSKSQFFCD